MPQNCGSAHDIVNYVMNHTFSENRIIPIHDIVNYVMSRPTIRGPKKTAGRDKKRKEKREQRTENREQRETQEHGRSK